MTRPAEAWRRFFLPGPVAVHPDLLGALTRPMIQHRGREMTAMLRRMQPKLQQLWRTTRPVLLSTSSATGFMEAAITSGVRRRALAVVSGYFGERFAQVGESCGREMDRLVIPEGESVTPEQLDAAIRRVRPDAVTLVHSETATGALAPLAELAAVVHGHDDVLLLVDAVTSLGGSPVEPDAWGLDFAFTGSQKALGLPPGLALGVASPRLLERARTLPHRGWYLDLLKHDEAARHFAPTQTPALPLVYALEAQLDRIEAAGGIAARWQAHAAMQADLEAWVAAHPQFCLMAVPGKRSRTVSALHLPRGQNALHVQAEMERRGYVLGVGLHEHAERILRIGHMGDVQRADLAHMLAVLADVVPA